MDKMMQSRQCGNYRANRCLDDHIAATGRPIKETVKKEIFGSINNNSAMPVRQLIDPVTGFVIVLVGGRRPIAAAVETVPKLGFARRRIVYLFGWCSPMPNLRFMRRHIVCTFDLRVPIRRRSVICNDGLLTE